MRGRRKATFWVAIDFFEWAEAKGLDEVTAFRYLRLVAWITKWNIWHDKLNRHSLVHILRHPSRVARLEVAGLLVRVEGRDQWRVGRSGLTV